MLLRFGGNAIFLSRSSSSDDDDGNDFVYLSSFTTLLSLLLRLLVMLKKERHSSAQHSPTAERAKLIQNSVVGLLFLRRDFDDFEARLRLGVRQFRVFD